MEGPGVLRSFPLLEMGCERGFFSLFYSSTFFFFILHIIYYLFCALGDHYPFGGLNISTDISLNCYHYSTSDFFPSVLLLSNLRRILPQFPRFLLLQWVPMWFTSSANKQGICIQDHCPLEPAESLLASALRGLLRGHGESRTLHAVFPWPASWGGREEGGEEKESTLCLFAAEARESHGRHGWDVFHIDRFDRLIDR